MPKPKVMWAWPVYVMYVCMYDWLQSQNSYKVFSKLTQSAGGGSRKVTKSRKLVFSSDEDSD